MSQIDEAIIKYEKENGRLPYMIITSRQGLQRLLGEENDPSVLEQCLLEKHYPYREDINKPITKVPINCTCYVTDESYYFLSNAEHDDIVQMQCDFSCWSKLKLDHNEYRAYLYGEWTAPEQPEPERQEELK
jgi:hypothetical protein